MYGNKIGLCTILLAILQTGGCSSSISGTDKTLFADAKVRELVEAAKNGDLKKVDHLISEGVNVNEKGKFGVTPLLCVLEAENKAGFACLLKHKADPNIRNDKGIAAVNMASLLEDPYWLDQSLRNGGDPNLLNAGKPFFPGRTPLFFAISKQRIKNVNLLIAAGANVSFVNTSGEFPLLEAAMRPSYDIVYALLEAGANYHENSQNGDNLIKWISRRNESDFPENDRWQIAWFRKCVEFLKRKGERIELRN
jgi:uncharacterized protein